METTTDAAITNEDLAGIQELNKADIAVIDKFTTGACARLLAAWLALLAFTGAVLWVPSVPPLLRSTIGLVWFAWFVAAGLGWKTYLEKTRTARSAIAERWNAFFSRYQLRTPAGEDLKFFDCSHNGTTVQVRYWDGEPATMPLGLLTDAEGRKHAGGVGWSPDANGNRVERMSTSAWETSDGRVGVVRGVVPHGRDRETMLTLKLEDGTLDSFDLTTLKPAKLEKDMRRIQFLERVGIAGEAEGALVRAGYQVMNKVTH